MRTGVVLHLRLLRHDQLARMVEKVVSPAPSTIRVLATSSKTVSEVLQWTASGQLVPSLSSGQLATHLFKEVRTWSWETSGLPPAINWFKMVGGQGEFSHGPTAPESAASARISY